MTYRVRDCIGGERLEEYITAQQILVSVVKKTEKYRQPAKAGITNEIKKTS